MTANAVAAPHHRSAEAAVRTLDAGGNAVDAAIAAVATQGVVAPETCGIGGDLFALVHQPGWDQPRALNASGMAGSKATAELLHHTDETFVPRGHRLSVTIPGCVDGFVALSGELGRVTLSDALGPAIEAAENGFEVSTEQARSFASQRSVYADNPAVAEFYPRGRAVEKGESVSRPALAATLRDVANQGRDGFYLGRTGEDIVEAVGGLITSEDLEENQARWVDPIGVEVAGLTAWTTPPNSQGYLGPGALAVFEMLGPPDDPSDPLWWHLLIEAYRCLAWERSDIVADPDHTPLPDGLYLDRDRLERAASTVSADRAGIWPDRIGRISDTAYLCVADSDGMAVSIIQSNYHGTGSPFGAARSGFLLHDRGAGFSLTRGHPNELAPGKRPLHTLSPTLWTGEASARWLLGARGGAIQPQLVAQVAARAVLGNDELGSTVGAPRWAVANFGPGSEPLVKVEPGIPASILSGLRERGHEITELAEPQPGWGPLSMIELDGDRRQAASDPRVDTATSIVW